MKTTINVDFERKLAILFSEYEMGITNVTYEHPASRRGDIGKITVSVVYVQGMKKLTEAHFEKSSHVSPPATGKVERYPGL